MDSEERNPFSMSRLAGTQLSPGVEDEEEDESPTSEGSPSEEREGTIWGGEVGGAASGETGWAIYRGMVKKGVAEQKKG